MQKLSTCAEHMGKLLWWIVLLCIDTCQHVLSQEHQIMLVRELLTDKNNRTALNEKDREKLAFLSMDCHTSHVDTPPKRLMWFFISDEKYFNHASSSVSVMWWSSFRLVWINKQINEQIITNSFIGSFPGQSKRTSTGSNRNTLKSCHCIPFPPLVKLLQSDSCFNSDSITSFRVFL